MSDWPSSSAAMEVREALSRHHMMHAAASVRTARVGEEQHRANDEEFKRQDSEKEQRRLYLHHKNNGNGARDMWHDPTFDRYDAMVRHEEALLRMTPLERLEDELVEVRKQLDLEYHQLHIDRVNEAYSPWPDRGIIVRRIKEAQLTGEIARMRKQMKDDALMQSHEHGMVRRYGPDWRERSRPFLEGVARVLGPI